MTNTDRTQKALRQTIKKMVPAVMIAMISTTLGLLSLYRSSVPMIQDFGSMLSIGIVIAFIIAVFIFIPFLYIKDLHFPKANIVKVKKEKTNYLMNHIVNGILKVKYIIIVIAIILAGIGIYVDQQATAETNLENFMPQDSEALADIRELRSLIGSTEQIAILFEEDTILNAQNLLLIDQIQNYLYETYEDSIIEATSIISLYHGMGIMDLSMMNETTLSMIPVDQSKLFINEAQTKTIINVSISPMSNEVFEDFIQSIEAEIASLDTNMRIVITGQSIIDTELMNSLTSGRYEITLIRLALIFMSLLVIYRSLYRAILPLIPIILIVGWSGGIMMIFGIAYTPLTATLGALIMGIGTEFTILVTERFEEELAKGNPRNIAIQIALSKMTNPILVSALTTMGGFSALIFSDFVILSNFGIMTLVNLSLALLSTIIVLPAILAMTAKKKIKVLVPAHAT